jgi:hypothetical protein
LAEIKNKKNLKCWAGRNFGKGMKIFTLSKVNTQHQHPVLLCREDGQSERSGCDEHGQPTAEMQEAVECHEGLKRSMYFI